MIQIRKSNERGHFDHGWLNTYHSFSFDQYHDPKHMGFRVLRVINEDYVASGEGFPTHGHRDMEIITYVVEGACAHKDSMGNSAVIRPGEVQRMSAGKGVQHSEFNPNADQPLHLLQIWIFPEAKGITPSYGQKAFDRELATGNLILVASHDGRDGSVSLNQDVSLYAARPKSGTKLELPLKNGRYGWIQVVHGGLTVNGQSLQAGDGASISDENLLKLQAEGDRCEFLLFDLP